MVIGICDDERTVREQIERVIRSVDGSHTILHFADGRALLAGETAAENPAVDAAGEGRSVPRLALLFLDIDFRDELDGMQAARRLKGASLERGGALSALPLVVFVTGLPERMPEAFAVHAFGYVVKPIDERELAAIFRQAKRELENIAARADERKLILRHGGTTSTVALREILWIECSSHKLHLHLADRTIEYYGRISEIEREVGEEMVKTHRSYLVNPAYVTNYRRTQIELTDGTIVPLSKHRYRDFLDAYLRYCGRESG